MHENDPYGDGDDLPDASDSEGRDPYESADVGDGEDGPSDEYDLSEPVEQDALPMSEDLSMPQQAQGPAPYYPTPLTPGDIAATTIHCSGCGYNLTGITIGGTCPECGMGVGESIMMGANQTTSGLAVASMVIGIVAILPAFCPCIGAVLPLIGLPLGIVAINQCTPGRFTSSSRGMSIAGIITNSIAIVIQGLMWLTAFL